MKREDANKLIILTEPKVLEALKLYQDLRTSHHKDSLYGLENLDQLRRVQGALEELGRLNNLKDEIQHARD